MYTTEIFFEEQKNKTRPGVYGSDRDGFESILNILNIWTSSAFDFEKNIDGQSVVIFRERDTVPGLI